MEKKINSFLHLMVLCLARACCSLKRCWMGVFAFLLLLPVQSFSCLSLTQKDDSVEIKILTERPIDSNSLIRSIQGHYSIVISLKY